LHSPKPVKYFLDLSGQSGRGGTRVISKGDTAPAFEGGLADGTRLGSQDFRGRRHLVLYFFAKDFTPG